MDNLTDNLILENAGQGAGRSESVSSPLIASPNPWLGHLLLISLVFMLNLPLFFTLNTGMDLYGFFTLAPVKAYPLPAVLSTVLNLGMAALVYVSYRWLWHRLGVDHGRDWDPLREERFCRPYRSYSHSPRRLRSQASEGKPPRSPSLDSWPAR